ncbi:MAG: tetratricopeptide repeat protein [Treponema sp.]|nr:tetratricopeptide repeat protein [Treponema sp.]
MSENKEKTTVSSKLNSFLEKNRVWLFTVLGVLVAAVVVCIVVVSVSAKSAEKTLTAVDEITYEFTKDSSSLSDDEMAAKRASALSAVEPYLTKGGVGGVRANMLAADLYFQGKNYSSALECYKAAVSKGKKSYTAPLSYFNMAVCCEELGNNAEAVENYKVAAEFKGFVLRSHALFSTGRVYEAMNDYAKAAEAYNTLIEATPNDSWAQLAKTRVMDMKLKGNIQ